ncbi:hypothetical protein TNIN_217291 [Trichonephila inaurata madagascariensis]|uniref:Uncharacterized protein n=1 Tax=Trichonephila inaurata madagascariensis TaxID=2747483 RepID=A0A8X7BNZ0_9ARAC|nr:hypothetical protein TNIN_217291 [Trichonephila inaurata madagascariensis]
MFFNAGVGGTIIVEPGVERSRTTQICQRLLTLLTNQLPLNNLNDCFKTLDEFRTDEKFGTLLEELWHEMSFLFLFQVLKWSLLFNRLKIEKEEDEILHEFES